MIGFPNNEIPLQGRDHLRRVAVFCFIIFFVVTPFAADAARVSKNSLFRASIRTGNANVQASIQNRTNVTETYIRACCDDTTATSTSVVEVETLNEVETGNSLSLASVSGNNSASGNGNNEDSEMTQITLRELGLLQLAAHDFFNVDRTAEVDTENGNLDLSTLLDHGFENIAIGGEARNRENIILFSVAKEYGALYLRYLERKGDADKAREKIVEKYHDELKDLYEDLFQEPIPNPKPGAVTMTENLAFRIIHDLLPGKIQFDGELINTVDPSLIGKILNKKELKAMSSELDGQFDDEFLNIIIVIPPSTVLHINLLERDSSFATQFSTDHSFEHFLAEVADGTFDADENVMHFIRELFAKGLYFTVP